VAGGLADVAGELAYAELMVQGLERAIRRMHLLADVAPTRAGADVGGPGAGADVAAGKAPVGCWCGDRCTVEPTLSCQLAPTVSMRTTSLSLDKTKMD